MPFLSHAVGRQIVVAAPCNKICHDLKQHCSSIHDCPGSKLQITVLGQLATRQANRPLALLENPGMLAVDGFVEVPS